MKITFQQLAELEEQILQDRNRVNWAMGAMRPGQAHYDLDKSGNWELEELLKQYSPDLYRELQESEHE